MSERMPAVRAVDRALDLIDLFLERTDPLSLNEVARLTGMPRSTAYRLLLTLEGHGYVQRRGRGDKFDLGRRILRPQPGRLVPILQSVAQPVLDGLRDTCGETAGLHWLDGDERVCIAAAEGVRTMRTSGRVGGRAPLYSGASARAILAFQSEERWAEVIARTGLKPLTDQTITDPELLRAELLRIRREGYAFSVGEWRDGIASLAVPVFDETGTVIGSVNISGPSFRFGTEKIQLLAGALQAAARAIGERLRTGTGPGPGKDDGS